MEKNTKVITNSELRDLTKEFVDIRKEYEDISADNFHKVEQKKKEFFFEMKELCESLKGYGYAVEIGIDAIAGLAKPVDFHLILKPYEIEEEMVLGIFADEEHSKFKIFFTFYYDFDIEMDAYNAELKKQNKEECYISIPNFLFIQIYNKKDKVFAKLKEQIKKDIEEKIEFNKMLLDIHNRL